MRDDRSLFTDDDFRVVGLKFCDNILRDYEHISKRKMVEQVRNFRDYFERY